MEMSVYNTSIPLLNMALYLYILKSLCLEQKIKNANPILAVTNVYSSIIIPVYIILLLLWSK